MSRDVPLPAAHAREALGLGERVARAAQLALGALLLGEVADDGDQQLLALPERRGERDLGREGPTVASARVEGHRPGVGIGDGPVAEPGQEGLERTAAQVAGAVAEHLPAGSVQEYDLTLAVGDHERLGYSLDELQSEAASVHFPRQVFHRSIGQPP